jgi:hypothetical protein
VTAKLTAIPCSKPDEPCVWCHKSFPCAGQGFSLWNCPRVSAYNFLDAEQIHPDGWYIGGVSFREDIVLEGVIDEGTDE